MPDVAAVLWSSISSALTLSCIRTYGQEEAAALEYEAEQRRHELRLASSKPENSDVAAPWRCARAHLTLDSREGLRPEAAEDSAGRVWLRYRTPHWSGHGTVGPPATPAAFGPAIGQARYRGRQATTAARFGGPAVAFIHTHDLTDGDAYDAGYFIEHAQPHGFEGHYHRRSGEAPPSFAARPAPPQSDDEVTPWVSAATWRMIVLAERLGPVGAATVIEHAFRTVLTTCWQWLPTALGLQPIRTPSDAAGLYAATARLIGNKVLVTAHDGHASVRVDVDRLWDGHTNVPTTFNGAMVRAWSASLTHHHWGLHARLIENRTGPITILFDLSGPGD